MHGIPHKIHEMHSIISENVTELSFWFFILCEERRYLNKACIKRKDVVTGWRF